MTENEIVKKLTEARTVYYNSDTPLMTDSEFDALEDRLREIDPGNDYFSTVGVLPENESGGGKIRHEVPMLSMGKAKDISQIEKWMKKLSLPESQVYCIQPKIDGLSASCRYRDGKLLYVATRGDGRTGQDISHIARYMTDIKETISFSHGDIEVRGELYLPKDTNYDTKGKPLRNNCVGLINRKEGQDELRHVRFVAYQISDNTVSTTESEKIEVLSKEGFHTVTYSRVSSIEEIKDYYDRYIDENRDKWLYETDGLIVAVDDNSLHDEIDSRWVVDHHHHYAIAFKPPAAFRETALKDIEWQVSRQGNVVPVALFEPVVLGGATLERASLHNFAFVESLMLRQGDTLVIERANDVIPYVRSNKSNRERTVDLFSNSLLPDNCPSCGKRLTESGVHLKCDNGECPEQLIQKIMYWVREAEIEQVSIGTVRALFNSGKIRKIRDLYELTEEDFENLEGFGDKKIGNFIEQVYKSRELTPVELISRLGIPLVQKKALKKLNIATIDDFLAFNDETYVIGQNIIEWKNNPGNMDYLNELISVVSLKEEKTGESKGTVALTGKGPMGRKELAVRLEEMGYEFVSSVTGDTDILICEDPSSGSSKLQKAVKLGVRLVSYEEFFSL
ncbi:MAG: NAD-dependent DNA ligase LigA [Spirochaetales bacterium]|nr:NAD-dependent DNA ligase LigA [Spirochaetales bacterium]